MAEGNPMAEHSERDIITSIERGFAVLLAFDAELPEPSLADLAETTGLSRPAVRRILLTLQKLGYVASLGSRWTLTPRVLTIGQHYAATHGIVEVAQPHLVRVTERTGESASLSQLSGTDTVYVARVNVRRVLGLNVDIGTHLPTHATSSGQVLAAYGGADVVDAVVADGLPALTPRTITDPIAFRDRLHEVRSRGYAIVDSELEDGFLTAAAPVLDSRGHAVAAVAYSTSVARHSVDEVQREVVPVLVEVASDIGRALEGLPEQARQLRLDARSSFS
jgi:IclR family transcriptional regulator, pca regulon regulatory protein